MGNYKYDIAISLCNQDIDFACKLKKALNPKLNVFIYQENQEDIISKSGPDVFAKCFKEDARVVVILSRNEWGQSFYTDIENSAIVDRLKSKGYGFLIVIPMEAGQKPHWYPETRIYIDPKQYTIDLLAKFIEFRVTEEGGVVNPLTSEEYSAYFIDQLKEKRRIVGLQTSLEATNELKSEIDKLKNLFNAKAEYFSKNNYQFSTAYNSFIYSTYNSYFGLGGFLLTIEIQNIYWGYSVNTTQEANLWIRLSKANQQHQHTDIKTEQYKFYFSENLKGWSIPVTYSGNNSVHINHLFNEYGEKWYDLKNPISTENLLDKWFTELWKLVKNEFDEVL